MRVAIVEDSPDVAEMLTAMLGLSDVETVTFTDDFASLLSAEPWQGVDVALVDLMLPGIDGDEILAYLASHHPTVRRVVLSAVAHQRLGLDQLAHAVVTKPVDTRSLLRAIGVHDDE